MADSATNTDRELWRARPGDFYSDSVFVTESGGIGINCGGTVVVKPIAEWLRIAIAEDGTRRKNGHELPPFTVDQWREIYKL